VRRWAWMELILIAVATCVVHVLLHQAQRTLWLNGLDEQAGQAYPRPNADPTAGGAQAIAVIVLGALACALFAWLVLRAGRFAAAGVAPFAIAVPFVLAIGWWLAPPSLSIDAYSYLSHGYLAATTGSNPYLDPSASVIDTPYGAALAAEGWQPVHPQSPYGPLWTGIERSAYMLSGGDVQAGVLLVKLPELLAVLGTAALIGRFLRDAAPDRRLRGVLLYLANPLVLVELTGDGHNDGLMVALLVLSILAAARARSFLAVVALAMAVLVKANALPFVVPIAIALIMLRRSTRALVLQALLGLVLSAGIGAVLVAPYWSGPATFQGLGASGTPSGGWSVAGLIRTWLVPPDVALYFPDRAAGGIALAQGVVVALLVVGTVAASIGIRTVEGLARACGVVSVLVLLLLPLEWPWYAVLPAAVLPLVARAPEAAVALLLAVASRLVAPIGDASQVGAVGPELFDSVQALVGQTVPAVLGLAVLLAAAVARRRRARVGPGAPA
jgi:hypothetical protein